MPAGLVNVFSAAVPLDLLTAADPELQAFYEGPTVARVEGLFAHWFGVATVGGQARIALVSGWESAEAIVEFTRANRLPRRTGPIGQIVALGTTEQWELVDQIVSTFEPGDATVLRLVRAALPAEERDAVIARLATARELVPARTDVAVSQLATRRVGQAEEVLVLTAWRSAAALDAMAGRLTSWWGRLAVEHGLGAVDQQTFELRPSGMLRLTPRGPAVVITDDRGLIVDATPAAVGMLGRSIWDLFALRFDDLPRLLDDGTALIARPEGGAVRIHVVRAANMPAPGRHAALLIPAYEPTPAEASVEAAIAAAYRRGPADPLPDARIGEGAAPATATAAAPAPLPAASTG